MREFLKRHSSVIVLILMLITTFLGMWFSGKTAIPNPRIIGMAFTSFFQNLGTSTGKLIGDSVNSVQQLSELRTQYEALVKRLQVYEEKQSDIESLRAENERLKIALGFSSAIGYSNLPAQVIAKDPGILFSTITINKGFNDGVRRDMPVIAIQDGQQGLVGKVQELGPSSAQIIPVFDSRSYLAARIDKNRFEGLVQGGGTSLIDLQMLYVAQAAKTSTGVGDLVVTSGLNSIFPPNLIIGKIATIESKAYEPSLSLTVSPFVEFSKLEYVYLLVSKDPGVVQ